MASGDLTVAALGRPFTLGMLYDACEDKTITGLTLWDVKSLEENTIEENKKKSEVLFYKSDSTESKSSLLDIETSLKASFLSGTIEVEGSAKYLNDIKKSRNQSRMICQYKAATCVKKLINLPTVATEKKDIIKRGIATHVVTGIEYGANAIFVFDSDESKDSRVQNIHGSMEAVINKFPSVSIEASGSVTLNNDEKEVAKKLSCNFYGDFRLNSNPRTFDEAMQTYAELPKLLEEKGNIGVPMKVSLMPLTNLDPKAAELKREISPGLVRKMQDALEDLGDIKRRCSDSLRDRVVANFPHIKDELRTFQNQCNDYETTLKQTMAKKFPLIRAGKEDERSAEQFFEDREKSPFSQEKLTRWLQHKEREINVIRSCVGIMEKTQVFENQSNLETDVFRSRVNHSLCFVFTSLDTADPCLDEMTKYLASPKVGCSDEDHWYYSDQILTKMTEKAESFSDLAKALKNNRQFRFLVAVIANDKYKGATIYHYQENRLVTENFSKPDIPAVETITDKRDLIWHACNLTLDPNTVYNYITLSDDDKKATCGMSWQTYREDSQRFDSVCQVLCKEGLKGRHYWEVEWSNGYYDVVGVAVTYERISRKGGGALSQFGQNNMSWYFGHYNGLYARHNGKQFCGPLPTTSRVGVFLDHPAGTLSFYKVCSNTMSHLYTFRTKFTDPLYPGFWIENNYDYIHLNIAE